MDPIIGGALIGAGASLVGGMMGQNSAEGAARANIRGQREFAQKGIQWKVKDAKAAGIHPLYALGASTHSFSPSVVGDNSMGNAVADMGQNVGRAVAATSTAGDRAYDTAMKAELLKRARNENTLLEGQITSVNKANNPAFPGSVHFMPGQGESALVTEKALERTRSIPGDPSREGGAINSLGYMANPDGSLTPTFSKDAKERLEDSPNELLHFYRNNIVPNLGDERSRPPRSALPKGAVSWRWSKTEQAYVPQYPRKYNMNSLSDRVRMGLD